MKIDWTRKLTSRKFWMAIASFISMMIVASGGTENQASQAVALIMAGATVVAYILGEGLADSGNAVVGYGEIVGDETAENETVTSEGADSDSRQEL